MSTQLTNYSMLNAIVDKSPSEYLPHHIIETALTTIVLLDLSNAFDTLDHNILSIRPNEICKHGQVYSWLISFVSFRTSSVKIKSSLSKQIPSLC